MLLGFNTITGLIAVPKKQSATHYTGSGQIISDILCTIPKERCKEG